MDKQSNDEPLQVADVAYVSVPQAEASALPINDGARAYLNAHHWPPGLQDTFLANLAVLSIRYFICDDSGSMVSSDGNRRVGDGTYSKYLLVLYTFVFYCISHFIT